MTIESDLHLIATSLQAIAAHLTTSVTKVTQPVVDLGQPVAPAPAPVVAAPVVPTPKVTEIAVPVFTAPVTPITAQTAPSTPVTAAPSGAPFSDTKGMIGYVMSKYKALGAEKGAKIQEVLKGLGVVNINEVRVDQYAALYAGVEALS
jgi:hypothetical protein